MFKINEKVIYPAHGVCQVSNIVVRSIGKTEKEFYVLKTGQVTLIVPTDENVIRPIASQDEIKEAIDFANNGEVKIDNSTWNRRYRNYIELLKSGQIKDVALVYRSLKVLQLNKDLSFGERKMLDCAKELLQTEIEAAGVDSQFSLSA